MGRTTGLGRACRWAARTAAVRRRHAGVGGGSAVVTRTEERGGEEEGLTGWHSGVVVQWLARDHGMG
jgi:hypothetical protein